MDQALFQNIKRLFFPRWDQGDEWTLEEHDDLHGADACCRIAEKKIQICSSEETLVQLEVLLLHEICHAVTNGRHGKLWSKRMEKAAVRAEQLDKHYLAAAINSEIQDHRTRYQACSAPLFYGIVRDLVFLNYPGHTQEEILSAAGRAIGLSHEEVVANYPRAPRVVCSAQREAEACLRTGDPLATVLNAQAS